MFCQDGLPVIDGGLASGNNYLLILFTFWSGFQCTAAAIKAIRESGMNLNPEVEETLIRVPIPKYVWLKFAYFDVMGQLSLEGDQHSMILLYW